MAWYASAVRSSPDLDDVMRLAPLREKSDAHDVPIEVTDPVIREYLRLKRRLQHLSQHVGQHVGKLRPRLGELVPRLQAARSRPGRGAALVMLILLGASHGTRAGAFAGQALPDPSGPGSAEGSTAQAGITWSQGFGAGNRAQAWIPPRNEIDPGASLGVSEPGLQALDSKTGNAELGRGQGTNQEGTKDRPPRA